MLFLVIIYLHMQCIAGILPGRLYTHTHARTNTRTRTHTQTIARTDTHVHTLSKTSIIITMCINYDQISMIMNEVSHSGR